jgi:hypothetical protein
LSTVPPHRIQHLPNRGSQNESKRDSVKPARGLTRGRSSGRLATGRTGAHRPVDRGRFARGRKPPAPAAYPVSACPV